MLAMNPTLTIDEINAFLASRTRSRNDQSLDDFFGKSPNQIQNWLYAPFSELTGLRIQVPSAIETSPVMSYLKLLIQFSLENGQAIKLTTKGNLPVKLVKQASALMTTFAQVDQDVPEGLNLFAGSQEEKLMALHYTRLLAELAGIFYKRSGRLQLKTSWVRQYQVAGVAPFFLPVLEAATRKFNWGYFDGYDQLPDLQLFCIFMIWRLQVRGSIESLVADLDRAFPAFIQQIVPTKFARSDELLARIIRCRFAERFLNFWGFVAFSPSTGVPASPFSTEKRLSVQPLMREVFQF